MHSVTVSETVTLSCAMTDAGRCVTLFSDVMFCMLRLQIELLSSSRNLGAYFQRERDFDPEFDPIQVYIIFGLDNSNVDYCAEHSCTVDEMFTDTFNLEDPFTQQIAQVRLNLAVIIKTSL